VGGAQAAVHFAQAWNCNVFDCAPPAGAAGQGRAGEGELGAGLFVRLSRVNHACCPNAARVRLPAPERSNAPPPASSGFPGGVFVRTAALYAGWEV